MRPSRSVQQKTLPGHRIAFTETHRLSHHSTFATQGNQGFAHQMPRRSLNVDLSIIDHYTPEKIRMECVLEKPVAPLPRPPNCRKSTALIRFLELAKGFEPPTP